MTVVSIIRDCSRILHKFVWICDHVKASAPDQLPFELGLHREDAAHEAAGRGGSVDLRAGVWLFAAAARRSGLRGECGELRERMAHLEGLLEGLRAAITARSAAS